MFVYTVAEEFIGKRKNLLVYSILVTSHPLGLARFSPAASSDSLPTPTHP